ncbi:MAG: hypothetical protein ACXWRA_06510 [Pseudobdellovibrionaceae bacterium]
MWKFIAYCVISSAFLGLAYQNYSLRTDNIELHKNIERLQFELGQERSKERKLTQQVQLESSELQREFQIRKSEIDKLEMQLVQEKAKLEVLTKQLADLRSKKQIQDSNSALQLQISRDKERLKDLDTRLKEYQGAEKDLTIHEKQAIETQKSQLKYGQNEINKQLLAQQDLIKKSEKDLNEWKKRKNDINQRAHVEELSKQLDDQRIILRDLQIEKQNLALDGSQHVKSIQGETVQENGNLKSTEAQIREQITNVQADLKKLEMESGNEQVQKTTLQTQLQSTQDAFVMEQQRMTSLTSEINRKKGELQALQSH